jgi:hypothetical protein
MTNDVEFTALPGTSTVALPDHGLRIRADDANAVFTLLIGSPMAPSERRTLRSYAWWRARRRSAFVLMLLTYLSFMATVGYISRTAVRIDLEVFGGISVLVLTVSLIGGVTFYLTTAFNARGELAIQVAKLTGFGARMNYEHPSPADVNEFAVISGAAAKPLLRVFTNRHINVAVRPEILDDVTRKVVGFMIAAPGHPETPLELEGERTETYTRFARATLVLAVTGRLDLYRVLAERAEHVSPVRLLSDSETVSDETRELLRPLAQSGLFGLLTKGALPLAATAISVVALIASIVRPV